MLRNTLLTVSIVLIAQTVLAAEGATKPAADKRPTKIWNRTDRRYKLGIVYRVLPDHQRAEAATRRSALRQLHHALG